MRVVKPSEVDRDVPRGVVGGAEISQATTGATNIYMGVFRVPPGARSRPHYHEGCESAVYMLSGALEVRWGDHLEETVEIGPGDMVYVPPRETHILVRTTPTPSRPSTSSRATRRPRTRSRCPGRRARAERHTAALRGGSDRPEPRMSAQPRIAGRDDIRAAAGSNPPLPSRR